MAKPVEQMVNDRAKLTVTSLHTSARLAEDPRPKVLENAPSASSNRQFPSYVQDKIFGRRPLVEFASQMNT